MKIRIYNVRIMVIKSDVECEGNCSTYLLK